MPITALIAISSGVLRLHVAPNCDSSGDSSFSSLEPSIDRLFCR